MLGEMVENERGKVEVGELGYRKQVRSI